jgi:hypothetical protein
MKEVDRDGTPANPVYRAVKQKCENPEGTQLYVVSCSEGWRTSIVCTGMYQWAAEWLVEELQGKPFAPGRRP